MNSTHIDKIIVKIAELIKQEYNPFEFKEKYAQYLEYQPTEIGKFIDDLTEKAQKISITLLTNHIEKDALLDLVADSHFPVLVFYHNQENVPVPLLIYNNYKDVVQCFDFGQDKYIKIDDLEHIIPNLVIYEDAPDAQLNGCAVFITAFPLKHLMEDYFESTGEKIKKLTPGRRLWRLLFNERKDIVYIYIYAVIVGIVNLSLPLGIQAAVSQISGGMFFSSVIVLIALVILGILVGGGLQVMQITLVEVLQQRVFAKASFELAYRITKVKMEALLKYHPPELMNRFFDVVNIQKGLPKLFVDITGALLQIFFGLLLLSLYHPFFLIFAILLVGIVAAIFYVTGPRGLKTSIMESKYKYKIAHWLEELARTVDSFKLAGNTNLPIQKMDDLVNSYLYYRKNHFKVLLTQFANIVAFKTLITGGLLILGTILVVNRQITLGQFVASEVIIILVVGAVEKLVLSIEVIYDLLTSIDKIAYITDLPLERKGGLRINLDNEKNGLAIHVKNLQYKYPGNSDYTIKGLDFVIQPGESICIAGANDSGKHTLMKILTGVLDSYEGAITINKVSLRDINLASLRNKINKNLSQDEIFYGTILDNITMGRKHITYQDVIWAIENVGLSDQINALPEGLYTVIGASGKKLSGSVMAKLILARSVASKPKLLIINDFSEHITKKEKLQILNFLQDKHNGWTLIVLSIADDPLLFSSCDRVIAMSKGTIAAQGTYEELVHNETFQKLIFKGKD